MTSVRISSITPCLPILLTHYHPFQLRKEEIPGQRDTKSTLGKFEENARPEAVSTKEVKAALKVTNIPYGSHVRARSDSIQT